MSEVIVELYRSYKHLNSHESVSVTSTFDLLGEVKFYDNVGLKKYLAICTYKVIQKFMKTKIFKCKFCDLQGTT